MSQQCVRKDVLATTQYPLPSKALSYMELLLPLLLFPIQVLYRPGRFWHLLMKIDNTIFQSGSDAEKNKKNDERHIDI